MSDFHPGSWNPAWGVATILTGLLSFMLSDEMTTGSVTSTDAHKRALATKSHAWNIAHQRFRDAFPEYCTQTMHDPPNMGEKERGKPDVTSIATPSLPLHPSQTSPSSPSSNKPEEITRPTGPVAAPAPGWSTTWRHFIYEKWRLCAFIALAVMVSRFSSRA
jgi:ubiquitin-conjugating enzyme E2 J2